MDDTIRQNHDHVKALMQDRVTYFNDEIQKVEVAIAHASPATGPLSTLPGLEAKLTELETERNGSLDILNKLSEQDEILDKGKDGHRSRKEEQLLEKLAEAQTKAEIDQIRRDLFKIRVATAKDDEAIEKAKSTHSATE